MRDVAGPGRTAPGHGTVRRHSIGHNVIAQVLGRACWVAVSLVLTPVLYGHLGAARFGVWALLSAAVSVALLLDFGLGPALMREVAAAATPEHRQRTRSALGFGLVMGGAAALVILALGYGVTKPLESILHLRLGSDFSYAVLATAGAAGALALGAPFTAVLDGTLNMQLTAAATAAGSCASAAVTVPLIETGAGLLAPAVGLLAYGLVRGLTAAVLVRSRFKEFWPHLGRSAVGEARALLAYGSKVQASNISAVVNVESDRWLLAGLYSTVIVAPYEVAVKITALPRLAATFALAPVFPLASRAHRAGDKATVDGVYLRATRYLTLVAAGCAALLVACGAPLVIAWIGRPLPFAQECLRLLGAAACFNLCTGAAAIVVRAEGHPEIETRYAILSLIVNLALTAPLLLLVGPVGAVAGSASAVVLASGYFFWYFHRSSGRAIGPLAVTLAKPWLAAAGAAAAGLITIALLPPIAGRMSALLALTAGAPAATLAYLALLWALGVPEAEERGLLCRLPGTALRRLRRRPLTAQLGEAP